jgi:uncharacterized protein YabE (DUF348 family)
VRRSLQLSLFAIVLLGLVGGLLAFFLAQKSLTLTVDGHARSVTTYADTVAEVLDDQGLRTAAHDVVLPAPGTRLADGDSVVVNRARPLQLTVDGVRTTVYVTARNVDQALDQLGYRGDNLVLSASRGERLPLGGMRLSISTPKRVTLVADGHERVLTTTAATAGDLLAEQHITVGPDDRTSLYSGQALLNDMRLQVVRVRYKTLRVTAAVPHKVVQTSDAHAYKGDRTVTTPGADGEQVSVYKVTLVDGRQTARTLVSHEVTKQPVTETVTVGTKARPTLSPSSDGLNWAALAKCESGGNPRAVNSAGYYGLYQFSLSTWASVGGTGNPINASAGEQTARAQKLYARGGAGQWGCGRHLFD